MVTWSVVPALARILEVLLFCCLSLSGHSFSVLSRCSRPSYYLKATKVDGVETGTSRIIVVGGGVGGLAVSSRIAASHPCTITILEKNEDAGGRCGSFDVNIPKVGVFRHERGPSLLLLPDVYEEIFQSTTSLPAAAFGLNITQCIPAYKVIFDDGDTVEIGFPRGQNEPMSLDELFSRSKMDTFEDSASEKWDAYMRACEAFLDCGLPNFIEERLDLESFPAFVREALRDFGKAWPLKPHSVVLDAFFKSAKMKALASFQDLYVGLQPYRTPELLAGGVFESTAPAVFGLLSAIELHPTNSKCGVFAPVGGFRAVSDSLQNLAEYLDVRIQCNTTVTGISSEGVFYTTDEEKTPQFAAADLVVVNADLPYSRRVLVGQSCDEVARFDWEDNFRYSCGVVAFHWSVGVSLADLNTHNVFLCAQSDDDARRSWEVPRSAKDGFHDGPFNFYVHRASKTDPSAAPAGMDSIMVLVPCPPLTRIEDYASLPRAQALELYREQFDEAYICDVREAVLRRLEVVESLKQVRFNILDEVVDTPHSFADKYNVAAGTPFALSHGLAQLSITRPGAMSSHLQNVLFCGASSRPGNGVPLVLTGARLVAQKAVSMLCSKAL